MFLWFVFQKGMSVGAGGSTATKSVARYVDSATTEKYRQTSNIIAPNPKT